MFQRHNDSYLPGAASLTMKNVVDSPVHLHQRRQPQQPKKQSKKWSPEEVELLVSAINAAPSSTDCIDWAHIALSVPDRTGKQCREKYKVGLPWSCLGVSHSKRARAG